MEEGRVGGKTGEGDMGDVVHVSLIDGIVPAKEDAGCEGGEKVWEGFEARGDRCQSGGHGDVRILEVLEEMEEGNMKKSDKINKCGCDGRHLFL